MSDEKKDRFQRIDRAIDEVREELDEAVDGTKAAGGKASKEVREAIDELEDKVGNLRTRLRD